VVLRLAMAAAVVASVAHLLAHLAAAALAARHPVHLVVAFLVRICYFTRGVVSRHSLTDSRPCFYFNAARPPFPGPGFPPPPPGMMGGPPMPPPGMPMNGPPRPFGSTFLLRPMSLPNQITNRVILLDL